jgi:hypothetical protein
VAVVAVADRAGEVHGHPAEGVDHLAESVEVDQQVVVDGDAEALLDGLDALAGAAVEGRVDLGRPTGAGDGDIQVARDRQHGGVAGRRNQVDDNDDVAALPAGFPEPALAQSLAGVGADHQQVDRPVGWGLAEAGHVHRADLAEPEGGVAQPPAARTRPSISRAARAAAIRRRR